MKKKNTIISLIAILLIGVIFYWLVFKITVIALLLLIILPIFSILVHKDKISFPENINFFNLKPKAVQPVKKSVLDLPIENVSIEDILNEIEEFDKKEKDLRAIEIKRIKQKKTLLLYSFLLAIITAVLFFINKENQNNFYVQFFANGKLVEKDVLVGTDDDYYYEMKRVFVGDTKRDNNIFDITRISLTGVAFLSVLFSYWIVKLEDEKT